MNNDFEILYNAISNVLSGQNNKINEGETVISQFKSNSDFAAHLFAIGLANQSPTSNRIAAMSILFRELENAYKMQHFPYDLTFIKNNIIGLIEQSFNNKALVSKIEEILSILVLKEYPHAWNSLLDNILKEIKNPISFQKTYGALKVVSPIFKAYQHSIEEERKPLIHLIQQFCPFLEKILFEHINNTSQESLRIINSVFKIFNWMIFLTIDDGTITRENFVHWFIAMKISITKKIILSSHSNNQYDWGEIVVLENDIQFKTKKNALALLSRVSRHMTNAVEKNSPLHLFYLENLTVLIECVVTQIDCQNGFFQLKNQPSGNFSMTLSPKCLIEAYGFLNYAMQTQINYQVMNSKMLDAVIYEVLIYSLQISPFELELYDANQIQYIYSSKNALNEPVMAGKKLAADVINYIAKYDSQFAKDFIAFIIQSLTCGFNIHNKLPLDDRFIEGLYFGLEEILDATKTSLSGGIDEIIRILILPIVTDASKNVFLKTRAFIILSKLHASIDHTETLSAILMGICNELCSQTSLYCKTNAIQALSVMLECEKAPELLKNNISDILNHTLALMKAINLDEIVASLQSVVISFGDEIRPFAKDILNNVLENFWDIIKSNEDLQKEDFDENLEKVEIIDSLESCVKSMTEILRLNFDGGFYLECKTWVLEIFNFMFECQNLRQVFSEVLRLFNVLISKLPSLDDEIIFYFPILCYSYIGFPNENMVTDISCFSASMQKLLKLNYKNLSLKDDSNICLNGLLTILGNIIQKGSNIFFIAKDFFGTSFLNLVFSIVVDLAQIGYHEKDDYNLILSLRLISFIFENCFEQTKTNVFCYQEILRYFSNFLGLQNRGKHFKCLVLSKLCILMYLDFEFFLNAAKGINLYEGLIYEFCGNTSLFADEDEKRLLLLAFIGIYKVPLSKVANIPLDFLTSGTHAIVTYLVVEDMKDKKSSTKNDDYVENNMIEEDDEDDDSWNEDDAQEEDNFDYNDPLETIEPVLELKKVWLQMQSQRVSDFNSILNTLPNSAQKEIFDSFVYFENKEAV